MVAGAIAGNAGQVCVAGSRLIEQRQVADRLIDGIAAAFGALRAGNTWNGNTTLSPIISTADSQRIDGMVQRTVQAGARLADGGKLAQVAGEGAFYQPTILTGVDATMEAVRDETFSPVLTVQVFDDEDEALALGDHPNHGLVAGVHTSDVGRALRCARGLEAGTYGSTAMAAATISCCPPAASSTPAWARIWAASRTRPTCASKPCWWILRAKTVRAARRTGARRALLHCTCASAKTAASCAVAGREKACFRFVTGPLQDKPVMGP